MMGRTHSVHAEPTTFGLKCAGWAFEVARGRERLARQADEAHLVLRHDGDPLSVDRAEVGVLKKTHHVGFAGFLDGEDCLALEAQVRLVLLGDLSHESLERQLADQ